MGHKTWINKGVFPGHTSLLKACVATSCQQCLEAKVRLAEKELTIINWIEAKSWKQEKGLSRV